MRVEDGVQYRGPWRFRARQVLGRLLLCAAVLCCVASVSAPASKTDRTAGAELFKQKGCAHCHGSDGIGTDRGPALSTVGKRLKKSEIERQIHDGGKQMPPFGDVLNDDEMHKLVDYLAHKKKAPKNSASGS